MHSSKDTLEPRWTRNVLYAAAIYNLAWGAAVIAAPLALFRWAGMEEPRYPQIWQCVGMIVGVYGVGYWLAARDPFRHWPIVCVGLLGKVLGPIGFLQAALTGMLPWRWGATIITNDLIWWVPFASILYLAFRHHSNTSLRADRVDYKDAVRNIRSHRNSSLLEMSSATPTLVVFLRHSGCTFCRETMALLNRQQWRLHRSGVQLALVHMGSPDGWHADVAEIWLDFGPPLQRSKLCFVQGFRAGPREVISTIESTDPLARSAIDPSRIRAG